MFTKTTLTGLRTRLRTRSMTAFVAMLMVVGLTVAVAPSASADAIGYGSYVSGNWWGTYVANGVKAACIDPRKAPPTGNPYSSSTVSAPASAYLLWNYVNVANSETGSLLSYMIQSSTDLPHSGKGGNIPEFSDLPSHGHANKWKSMRLDMDRNKGPYKVRITVTQNPSAADWRGKATAELLSAAGNRQPVAGNPNITVNLTATSAIANMPTSVTLSPASPLVGFYFYMGATATTGTITGTSTTAPPTVVTLLTAGDVSYQRMATVPPYAVSTAASDSDPASRPASPNGNMNAQMFDANNPTAGVAGADIHFHTYPGGRFVSGSMISGTGGLTPSISLPIGQYTANQQSAPAGFNPDAGTSPVVTVTSGGTVTAKLYNSEQGKVGIHKQDAQSITRSLAGAKFRVTSTGGQTLVDLVTGPGGNITSGYLPGGTKVGQTVRITELSAPAGYLKSPAVNQVVTRTGSGYSTVGDNQMGKVSVHLTDAQTGAGLAGASFQVSNGSTKFGQPGKTNANGDWTFPAYLPYKVGTTFRITQTITPAGYVSNNGVGTNVTLTRAGDGYGRWTLVNNEQGRVSVHKTDFSTAGPLSGAVFRVTRGFGTSTTTLATGTTDKNGDWLSPLLTTTAVGATGIRVDEVTAPPGFTRTAAVDVAVTRTGYKDSSKTPSASLADSRVYGLITVAKKDTVTKQVVAGVTFTATVSKIIAGGKMAAPVAINGPASTGTESPVGSGRYLTDSTGRLTLQGQTTTPQLVYGDKVTFTEVSAAAAYVQPVTAYSVTGTIGPNATLLMSAFNSPKRSVQITVTNLITKQPITTPPGAGFTICYTPKAGRPTPTAEKTAAVPCTVPTGTGLTDTTTQANVDPSGMILIDTVTSVNGKTSVSTPSGYAQPGDPVTVFQTSPPGGYVPGTTVARTTITDTGWASACSNTTAGGSGGTGVVIACNFVDQPIPTANITKRIVEWGTATTAAGYSPSGAHYLVKDVTSGKVLMSDAGPTDAAGKLTVQLPGVNLGDQISFTEITAPTGTTLDSTPILGTVKATGTGVGVSLKQDDMTSDPCGSTAWNYKVLDQPVVTGTVTPLSNTDAAMTPGSNVFALRSAGSATSTPVAPAFVLSWPAVGQALTYTVTRTPGDGSAGGTKTYLVSGIADAWGNTSTPDAKGNVAFRWSGDSTGAVDAWQSDYLWTVTANNGSSGSPFSAQVHLTSQAQAPTNVTVKTAKAAQTATTPAVLSNAISWGPPASAAGATPDGFHGASIVGYTVWLANAGGGWTAVGTAAPLNAAAAVNSGGTFADRGVPAGTTRQYAVTARVAMGDGESSADQALLSPFSPTVSAVQFAAPVKVTATSDVGTTTISWPALPAAQSLNIVRWQLTACPAAVPDRSLKRPDPTDPTSPAVQYGCLIKTGLTTSPYTVTGEPAGADLIYSATITDAAGDSPAGNDVHVAQAPPAPNAQACASAANIGGTACPGGAPGTNVISWTFPYDPAYKANNQLDQRAEFQIYRSLSTDVGLAAPAVDMTAPVLQSLDQSAANYFNPTVIAAATSSTTVTMSTVDLNRELGSNYDYAVVACNQNVQTLAWQCGTPGGTNVVPQYPAEPGKIVGDVQTPNVSDTLSWGPVAGATGYNVYRSDDLASCLSSNLTSVEENSLTTQLDSTGAVATNPVPISATTISNIAAPQASCYAFSVQAVNVTGAGPRSMLDVQATQASYIVQYPPVPCLNPAGSLPGANNASTTSFLSGTPADPTTCAAEVGVPNTPSADQFGARPARNVHTRAANVELNRRTGNLTNVDHPWGVVAIWHNTTGLENQTLISVNDPTGVPGIEYQYYTNVCSESLNTSASQCTSSPIADGQLDDTVITQP